MKDQLWQLLKLKEHAVKEVELALSRNLSSMESLERAMADLSRRMSSVELPRFGNFREIQSLKAFSDTCIVEMDSMRDELHRLESVRSLLRNKLRLANLEYEKVCFMYSEENQRISRLLDNMEAKGLEEVSSVLFFAKNRKRLS